MYDVMEMETGMLKYVMNYVKEHCSEEVAMLNAEIPEIKEIPTIRFHEAKQIMEEKYGHKSKNRYDLCLLYTSRSMVRAAIFRLPARLIGPMPQPYIITLQPRFLAARSV